MPDSDPDNLSTWKTSNLVRALAYAETNRHGAYRPLLDLRISEYAAEIDRRFPVPTGPVV